MLILYWTKINCNFFVISVCSGWSDHTIISDVRLWALISGERESVEVTASWGRNVGTYGADATEPSIGYNFFAIAHEFNTHATMLLPSATPTTATAKRPTTTWLFLPRSRPLSILRGSFVGPARRATFLLNITNQPNGVACLIETTNFNFPKG